MLRSRAWYHVILSLVVVSNALAEKIRYVQSTDSSPQSCSSHWSCHTLDTYVQNAATYFTTGSTFIFMAGNHSIRRGRAVYLGNCSNITFRGDNASSSSNTFILYENSVAIQANNVTNLLLENLAFTLYSSNHVNEPSALKITNCRDVQMYRLVFRGAGTIDDSQETSRAIDISNSSLTATNCLFEGNTANDGGAIQARVNSAITLKGNVFQGNVAKYKGGAIFAADSVVSIHGTLPNNSTEIGSDGWLDLALNAVPVMLGTLGVGHFGDNVARVWGGALCVFDSNVTLSGTTVVFRNNSARDGGGIYAGFPSEITSDPAYLYFIENRATSSGGAIHSSGKKLILGTGTENMIFFLKNSAEKGGGICSTYRYPFQKALFVLAGESHFVSNSASSGGGAISMLNQIFTLKSHDALFKNNTAENGGALYLGVSHVEFTGDSIMFESNSAIDGAAIYSKESALVTVASAAVNFIGNVAINRGGGIHASAYNNRSQPVIISAQFINNRARDCGGACFMSTLENVHLVSIAAFGNAESALCILESRVNFSGPSTNFSGNTGRLGGAIQVISSASTLSFQSYVVFHGNSAVVGGAIYSPDETSIEFSGLTTFTHNTAEKDGGALYALSTISFNVGRRHVISFKHNSAENGGAIFLGVAAFMTFAKGAFLNTSLNHAHQYGGAIYHQDAGIPIQCSFEQQDEAKITVLPYCSMRFTVTVVNFNDQPFINGHVQSYYDSAGIDGRYIYGGLLDRCQQAIDTWGEARKSTVPYEMFQTDIEVYKSSSNVTTRGITSKPYQLCFCEDNGMYNCLGTRYIEAFTGQRFSLSLVALDQLTNPTTTEIMAKIRLSQTARLEVNQSIQPLEQQCSKVLYNLYSSQDYEELILYPDGPCRDTGLATAIVNVTFLPCPDGFEKNGERCVCEVRLQSLGADCTIDEDVTIVRKQGSTFWVSGLYENDTYLGLILYKTCPSPYCKTDNRTLSIADPDIQCAKNRSGILCGACATNHSLMLGSSKCVECSDTYLVLLLPFAAAGIALVAFLSLLRLTVASGMLNSIILYANIVQVNRRLFLPSEAVNVLTVFVAWLNLDLGFETCFYNGMTAYSRTWLQFAFPLYVWILISLIIIVSRYSITLSKLIGHNPIAVLATLLLMSYNKVLNIVIDTYSFASLDYPGSKTVTVWLKDANVPYFMSWHLLLTVVTSLILVFLFLPYTFLLLLGYKLYRFSLFNRLKPFLDSYYAPYNKHTRYWTGFLLLVRCALYIVFSFNSLGATSSSLLAINATFTAIVILAWLSNRIYKGLIVNMVEASVYLNLVILSAATSNEVNSTGFVYTLISIVFVTTIGIILYHFHITYTAKSAISKMVTTRISDFRGKLSRSPDNMPPVDTPAAPTPEKIITKTVIELREPLLEK